MSNNHEMTDKLVLVTGATGGIGYIAARELARKGARVVIVGRNPQKTAAAVEQIKAAWPEAEVHIYDADHGFHCDQRGSFSAVPAGMAQARTFRYFAKYLG